MKLISLKTLKISLIILLLVFVSLFLFIFGSTSGLKTAALLLNQSKVVTLRHIEGDLLTGASFRSIKLKTTAGNLLVERLNFKINFKQLIKGRIDVNALTAKRIFLELNETLLKHNNLSLVSPHGKLLIEQFSTPLFLSLSGLSAKEIVFHHKKSVWSGKLTLNFDEQPPISLNLSNNNNPKDVISINGNTNELNTEVTLNKFLSLKGKIKQGFMKQHSSLTARLEGLQLTLDKKPLHLKNTTLALTGNKDNYDLSITSRLYLSSPIPFLLNATVAGNDTQLTVKESTLQHKTGSLNLSGQLSLDKTLNYTLKAKAQNFSLSDLNIDVKRLNFNLKSNGHFKNEQLVQDSTLTNLSFSYQNTPFKGEISLLNTLAQATLLTPKNKLTLKGDLNKTLFGQVTLNDYRLLDKSLANLKGTTELQVTLKDFKNAYFILSSQNLDYTLENGHSLPIKELNLNGSYKNNELTLKGKAFSQNKSQAKLNLSLKDLAQHSLKSAVLNGSLNFEIGDLEWLEGLKTHLSDTEGRIKGNLKFSGELSSPKVTSEVQLLAKTTVPALDLRLSPIKINLYSNNHNFTLSGSIYNQGSPLLVSGSGSFDNLDLQAKINLQANAFKLIDLDNAKVMVAPKLSIYRQNKNVNVTGTIDVISAKIQSLSTGAGESLSEDVIIKGETQPSSDEKSGLHYDLTINAKNNVDVNLYGLTGTLKGQLQITGSGNQSPHALGQVEIENGKYQAYGQNLTVEKGRLIYSGGRITNPGINLSAIRKISNFGMSTTSSSTTQTNFSPNFDNEIIAGIKLTGQLSHPKVVFFSNQGGLSQSDIFSLLVLGKTSTNNLGPEDGKLLLGVLSNTTLGAQSGHSNLVSELQHLIGLDDLSLETQSHYDEQSNSDQDESFLVLGKRLSNRLLVQYGMGFGDSNYLIRFKYLLNKTWSIQVESQLNASGFDVFYHYSRD